LGAGNSWLKTPLTFCVQRDAYDALCGVTAAAQVFLVQMANAVLHVPALEDIGYGVNGVYQHAVCRIRRTLKPAQEIRELAVAEVAVHCADSA
jgi:hypothetical protein